MSGLNKVMLIGHVGQDPEVKYLPNGDAVANFSLATSKSWKDQRGNKQERTEWHACTVWRKLAEVVGQYVHKGLKLYVEGELQTRSWEQDGVKRYKTEIVVQSLQMLDSKRDGDQRPATSAAQAQPPAPASFDNFDDDIPFS